MLSASVDFAYRIRLDCKTPRPLRELMILRTAQLSDSAYEWHQHRLMAAEAGVPEQQISELAMWRHSEAFDARERAALAFTEAMAAGAVNDPTHAELARHFDAEACIELAMTASYLLHGSGGFSRPSPPHPRASLAVPSVHRSRLSRFWRSNPREDFDGEDPMETQ